MTAHAGHTLSDWLALHELRPAACRQILEKLVVTPSAEVTAGEGPPTDANALQDKEAWTKVVDAMCCYFPAHRALISATFVRSPKIRMERRKGRPPALTLDEVMRLATRTPEMRARLGELGLAPAALASRAEVKTAVHGEIARWSRLVEAAGIERQ